jgi:hypothetical protein
VPSHRTEFALRLKRHRAITRRLTQVEYAAELGIHPISLSRYERDASPVGEDWVAEELTKVTGVPAPRRFEELSALSDAAEAAATAEPAVPPEGASPSDTEIADQLARRRPGGRARRSTGSARPRRPRPPQSEGE